MNAVRAGLAVAILILGIWANTNPDALVYKKMKNG